MPTIALPASVTSLAHGQAALIAVFPADDFHQALSDQTVIFASEREAFFDLGAVGVNEGLP
jgi:hypothetical protein